MQGKAHCSPSPAMIPFRQLRAVGVRCYSLEPAWFQSIMFTSFQGFL